MLLRSMGLYDFTHNRKNLGLPQGLIATVTVLLTFVVVADDA
jgi:hypothetical protein